MRCCSLALDGAGLSTGTGRYVIADVRCCVVPAIRPPEDEPAPIVCTTTTGIAINMPLAEAGTAFRRRIIDRNISREDIKAEGDVIAGIEVTRPDASDDSQGLER